MKTFDALKQNIDLNRLKIKWLGVVTLYFELEGFK